MQWTERHAQVQINWASNGGWEVEVGCVKRVYLSQAALLADLDEYLTDPGKVAKEFYAQTREAKSPF